MSATPLFEPLGRLTLEQCRAPHAHLLRLLLDARDIAGGAAQVFAFLQREDLDASFVDDNGQPLPPLMSLSTREELVQMTSASLGQLRTRLDAELEADAARLKATDVRPALAGAGRDLVRLVPANPTAGTPLTPQEADSLVRLRDLLNGKAVQQ